MMWIAIAVGALLLAAVLWLMVVWAPNQQDVSHGHHGKHRAPEGRRRTVGGVS